MGKTTIQGIKEKMKIHEQNHTVITKETSEIILDENDPKSMIVSYSIYRDINGHIIREELSVNGSITYSGSLFNQIKQFMDSLGQRG